jgi:hypothetical protein
MATVALTAPVRAEQTVIVKSVTVIIGTVIGLTFTFGFGNVLSLAPRLGVPVWVAPPVVPAVDLSILGLLLGTRHLALHGATAVELRPALQVRLPQALPRPEGQRRHGVRVSPNSGATCISVWPSISRCHSSTCHRSGNWAPPARPGPVPARPRLDRGMVRAARRDPHRRRR